MNQDLLPVDTQKLDESLDSIELNSPIISKQENKDELDDSPYMRKLKIARKLSVRNRSEAIVFESPGSKQFAEDMRIVDNYPIIGYKGTEETMSEKRLRHNINPEVNISIYQAEKDLDDTNE